MPEQGMGLGLRSAWLADFINHNAGYSKETRLHELQPLLLQA